MAYPAIPRKSAQQIANGILDALESGQDPMAVENEGSTTFIESRLGADYDRQAVERFSEVNRKKLLPDVSDVELTKLGQDQQTRLEAELAGPTHQVLSQLEVAALQDPDLWRYLALYPLRWYLLAREPELQPQDFGGTVETLSEGKSGRIRGTDMKKQLVFRTYLWGKCAFDDHDANGGPGETYRRATAINGGGLSPIDVWHSHMVRVQMGQLAEIPHAFIDVLTKPPQASTDEARELEKLLTRMKHNVLLDSYDYGDAVALVEQQFSAARTMTAEGRAVAVVGKPTKKAKAKTKAKPKG